MTTNLTRRTALLGTVTLPAALAPLGLANAATTPNATDAAWAELQTAKAAYEANRQAHDGWEAENVPERLYWANSPNACDFADGDDWWAKHEAWMQERATYRNPHQVDDDQLDALCQPMSDAQFTILETPAATVTDVERKLSVITDLARENMIEADWIEGVLADVRRVNGRAA